MPRLVAVAALAALSLAAVPSARAEGIFGSFFSRAPAPVSSSETPQVNEREREGRNLRREYWERERARLAQSGRGTSSLATETSNRSR